MIKKLKTTQKMEQLTKTAHHEAAHFVGFILYIMNEYGADEISMLEALSIIPDDEDESLGHMKHDKEMHLLSPELTVKVILSGPASDFILSGENDSFAWLDNRLGEQHDWQGSDADTLIDKVLYYVEQDGNITEFLHPVFDEVVNDMRLHWEAVSMVANKLLKCLSIEGEALKHLAQETGLINDAQL